MKKITVTLLIFLSPFFFTGTTYGAVVTEGMIDELVRDISRNVSQYKNETKTLLQDVSGLKKQISKKKERLKKADERSSMLIKSEITRDVSRLINDYKQYLGLTETLLDDTLPKLRTLRESLDSSVISRSQRRLSDPKYYGELNTLFSNLAGITLLLDDPSLKSEIGEILGDMETFYKQTGDKKVFDKIKGNIDQVIEGYAKVLAKVAIQKRYLEQKEVEVKLSTRLTKYILALSRLSDGKDLMQELSGMSDDIAKIDVPTVEVGSLFGDDTAFYRDNGERLQKYSERGLGLR